MLDKRRRVQAMLPPFHSRTEMDIAVVVLV